MENIYSLQVWLLPVWFLQRHKFANYPVTSRFPRSENFFGDFDYRSVTKIQKFLSVQIIVKMSIKFSSALLLVVVVAALMVATASGMNLDKADKVAEVNYSFHFQIYPNKNKKTKKNIEKFFWFLI